MNAEAYGKLCRKTRDFLLIDVNQRTKLQLNFYDKTTKSLVFHTKNKIFARVLL